MFKRSTRSIRSCGVGGEVGDLQNLPRCSGSMVGVPEPRSESISPSQRRRSAGSCPLRSNELPCSRRALRPAHSSLKCCETVGVRECFPGMFLLSPDFLGRASGFRVSSCNYRPATSVLLFGHQIADSIPALDFVILVDLVLEVRPLEWASKFGARTQ